MFPAGTSRNQLEVPAWNQFVTDYKDIAGNLKPRDFEYEQFLDKGGEDE